MINVNGIEKAFGSDNIFHDLSFSMGARERLGLIGRNGSGKSTLFKILLGQESQDGGTIQMPRGYRIGHLEQHLNFTKPTILDEALLGLPEEERIEAYRAEIILSGLGFSEADMQRPASYFSGGYQIRVKLAKVLLSEPNLLLLDEPTNYLDIVTIRWLTKFLRDWKNEVILITHDRGFMDAVCTHTMMIHRGEAKKIQGGTAKLIAQIAEDESNYEKTRVKEEKRREELELFISRFRAQAAKATLVQSKIKMLEKMGVKEALAAEQNLDFIFTAAPFETKRLGEVRDLSFGYPGRELLIQNISFVIKPGDRIGVIGRNGKGKSTFLRLVAGELTPGTGNVSFHPTAALGYFGQTNIDRLDPSKTVVEEIESANHQLSIAAVRTIAGVMMFSGDDGLKKIKVLSGGERSRVFLGKLLAKPTNILLLDEPTNHLDVESIEALVRSLESYNGSIMIVTHSEELLTRLANKLIVFKDDAPFIFDGSYAEFIEKGGWGDDDSVKPSARPAEVNTRRDRAEFVQQRSRDLRPIEKRVTQLTSRIESLEAKIAEINNGLVAASTEKNGAKVAELSTALAKSEKELASSYALLETASKELDEKTEYYRKMEAQG